MAAAACAMTSARQAIRAAVARMMRAARCSRAAVAMSFAAVVLAALGAMGPALGAGWEPGKDGLHPIPPLSGRVVDLTNTLSDSERQALDAKLAGWESRTTNQLAVLIVPTTVPESIDEFGIRVAEAWKIGQKGEDNGAIFIVAKDDKRMRIEVGYGFEGVLTDVTSRRIIGETVAPLFSQGRFAAGIDAGVDRIMQVVDSGNPLPPPGRSVRKPARGANLDFGTMFVFVLVAVPLVGGLLRRVLGNVPGSLVGAGLAGVIAWFVAGSLIIAGIAGVIAFFIILFSIFSGRGGWIPMGGGMGGGGFGGGGFGGGGGFSGGGGGFGGGGASGGWN
jgi:uncharacterized protein